MIDNTIVNDNHVKFTSTITTTKASMRYYHLLRLPELATGKIRKDFVNNVELHNEVIGTRFQLAESDFLVLDKLATSQILMYGTYN